MICEENIKKMLKSNDFIIRLSILSYLNESYCRNTKLMDELVGTFLLSKEQWEKNLLIANCKNLKFTKKQFREIVCLQYEENILLRENILALALKQGTDFIEDFYDEVREKVITLSTNEQIDLLDIYNKMKNLEESSSNDLLGMMKTISFEGDDADCNLEYAKRVCDVLVEKDEIDSKFIIEQLKNSTNRNYKIPLIYLIGELREKEAIDIILGSINSEDDILNETIGEALSKIGGDEVINIVYEKIKSTDDIDIKLYLSMVFESIKTEFSASICFHLMEDEKNRTMKGIFASALSKSFNTNYIKYVEEIVENGNYNKSVLDLELDLLAMAKINKCKFKNMNKLESKVINKLRDIQIDFPEVLNSF